MKRVKRSSRPEAPPVGEVYRALESGAANDALEQARALIADWPGWIEPRIAGAMAAIAAGDPKAGHEMLGDGSGAAAESMRAELFVAEKRYLEARETLARLIRIAPDNPIAYERLASIHRTEGELERALEENSGALALDPKRVSAIRQRGALLAELGRSDEAAETFRVALRAADTGEAQRVLLSELLERLDPERDAEEIAAAQAMLAKLIG